MTAPPKFTQQPSKRYAYRGFKFSLHSDRKVARSLTASAFGEAHVERHHPGDWYAVITSDTTVGPARTARDAFSNAIEAIDLGILKPLRPARRPQKNGKVSK
jgi:hypothetical protein